MNDDRLRTALRELGDVPPPPDLAGSALTRARRDRRRATAGVLVAVALLAAAVITAPTLLRDRPAPVATQTAAAPPPAPQYVTGYTTVATGGQISFPPGGTPTIHQRGGYSAAPWWITLPSPDGTLLAVFDAGRGKLELTAGQIGIVAADRAGDPAAVRWAPDSQSYGWMRWASDSSRLFFWGTSDRIRPSFRSLDVRTLAASTIRYTKNPDETIGALPAVPPGGGIAESLEAPGASSSAGSVNAGTPVETLRYYDDTGARTGREVRITGAQDFPTQVAQPFSPDGHLAAFGGVYSTVIADTRSGKVVRTSGGAFVGWLSDTRFAVASGRSVLVVDVPSGRVVSRTALAPAGRDLVNVWLAPVNGAAPVGAVVL